MSFHIQDSEHKEHAVVKRRQSVIFLPLPPPPLLIAFVHLYAVHHHFRQRSSGGLDCLVFAGVVKYGVMPAVFLMFMQRQQQTKQQNACEACADAEFSLPASSCCSSNANIRVALLYAPTCERATTT